MTSERIVGALWGVAAILLVAALVVPAATRPSTRLPPVAAADLIASIRQSKPGPLTGNVQFHEQLGLAGLSGLSHSPDGTRTARLWSDGAGRHRISLPSDGGERTVVDDGSTVWSWDSATRAVTKSPSEGEHPVDRHPLGQLGSSDAERGGGLLANPADAASALLAMLEPSSTVRVEAVSLVANRPAYQLVLDPLPTERTLMREVRVAVDGETRLPLEVTVMANGSTEPALRVGFSDLTFGPQSPALFAFTPPSGVAVHDRPGRAESRAHVRTLVGEGWDTVLVRTARTPENSLLMQRLSTPISGAWGQGRLVRTSIGNAVLAADGRVALGAVPAQVLTEALSQAPAR
ncbi:LolA family protein [Pseudonocardia spinosispora]|uniref:LolA family protein n=1 Tax=Pseudonocardia spinosispora TaxID=103441 RepID=UPI00040D5E6C|nr:hypothetical protein [Pseudonocardia spinosispora]